MQWTQPSNYFKHFFIFVSDIFGFVSMSAFALLVDIPIGIASSAGELKIYAITATMEKYKNKNKIVLFGKN